jgi:acetyltransferase-like isoleucine patch superfamily enzyme
MLNIARKIWARFWMLFAGRGRLGRIATWIATWTMPPYFGRTYLANKCRRGYISPKAEIHHSAISFGAHIFIGDRVVIYQAEGESSGSVHLGDRVHVHSDVIIQTGLGGTVTLGPESRLQPRCILSAYKGHIIIGKGVGLAPNCVLYPYNHGVAPDKHYREQPLESKGDIIIEDEAWLGVGVTVLDGVRIGKGAVVGAGSVVTKDIPEGAIAFGVPARVIKMRDEINK